MLVTASDGVCCDSAAGPGVETQRTIPEHMAPRPVSEGAATSGFYLVFLCLLQVPSEKLQRGGKVLRNAILSRAPHMIRDRKYHLKTYRLVCVCVCV